ncbi:MAG: hypothetical protein ACREDY_02520 [Bradyrhizobium sp.]
MLVRVASAAALGLFLASPPSDAVAGGGQHGIMQRVSCNVVRYYVAKYSASAAEMWARSHGASDSQIEAARRCLMEAPTQTAQATHWFGQ